MLKSILRIIFILVISIIPSIWIIQNDSKVQQYFKEKLIKSLEKGWRAKVEFQDFDLNLFTFSIYLKNSKASFSCDSKCIWKFEYAKIRLSKIFSLIKKRIYLDFILDDFELFVFDKPQNAGYEIQKHLADVFKTADSSGLDMVVKSIRINNLKLKIIESKEKSLFFDLPGRYFARKNRLFGNDDDRWQISANLWNGQFFLNNSNTLKEVNGFLNLSEQKNKSNFNAKFMGDFKLFDKDSFLFNGEFSDNKLIANLKTKKNKTNYKFGCDIGLNLQRPKDVYGKVLIKDLSLNDFDLGEINFDLGFDGEFLKSDINCLNCSLFEFKGKAESRFQPFKTGLFLKNTKPIFFARNKEFFIKENDFKFKLNLNDDFNFNAKYFINISQKDKTDFFKTKGQLSFKDYDVLVEGKTSFTDYLLKAKLSPFFYITKFSCFKNHDCYVDLSADNSDNILRGKVKNFLLKFLLPQEYQRLFLIDKKYFNLKIFQDYFSLLKGQILFDDGPFYLPDSYNLIEQFKTDFLIDLFRKKIDLSDFEIQFYKGSIFCSNVTLQLSDNLQPSFIYAPLQINDFLVNWGKTFYGFIYGNILAEKKLKKHLKINGDIILKKAVLKDNPLSGKQAFDSVSSLPSGQMDFEFDINLSNENPLKVDTDFLKAQSNFDLNVKFSQLKNRSSFSSVLGNIEIENGEVNFLKNKLYINHGQIQFMPNQTNDPVINISAKNKIKKYFITMSVSGTLQNPRIILESTPELTEEQILALLMAGSENASFQTDLPAILMQNLSNWVMERKNLLSSKTKSFFQKVTLPFKYVQITPNFTDQKGRGGIRGTISIDINKQLHAQIQKNFNLQEDFSFQVEYFLTDDINIKAIKDQRGELGSEMEVRFKF